MIVASFASAYGIRLRRIPDGDMSYTEFTTLLCNLPGNCQLAQLVRIRNAQGDELKYFTQEQLKLRSKWQQFVSEKMSGERSKTNSGLQRILKSVSKVVRQT